ncbi:MAG: SusC/RagA family TonB-linked outer membrane protein [Gemmatimonadota bacterium]|nr:SusC/RagA family TonB-linked outer membrane protein [Gemmatimonadota bacterium]
MSTRFRWMTTAVLALLLGASASASAQNATITGKILSDGGQPLYGANVVIDALTISVGTNAQGVYSIVIPGARVRGQAVVMRVRAIGYQPIVKNLTLTAGTQTHNFDLKIDVNRLNQVVVTGVTGATEVKKLAFTVAQVSQADVPVAGSNPLAQLQGKVAGANIVSASGRPGSAPSIILRGPQSINGGGRGQEPLYIIDGVVSQGGLADINPQDIENVEVVKGAAASSMYGSRAGNGVIQITTRSGKNSQDGIKFRVGAEYGSSDVENVLDIPKSNVMLMNQDFTRFCIATGGAPDCTRTVDIYAEAYRINDQGTDFSLPPATFTNDGGISRNPGGVNLRGLYLSNPFPKTGTPMRQMLTKGQTYNNTVDATGRVGRTNFFASANMFRQQGSLRFMNGYTRNSIRLNIDQQMAGNWNFGVRTAFTDAVDNNGGVQWLYLSRQPANAELTRRDSKGRLFVRTVAQAQGAQNFNPAYYAEFYRPQNRISRFVGALNAKWQPLTWIDASAEFGYDGRTNFQTGQLDRGYRTTASSSNNLGSLDWSNGKSFAINGAAMVTMRKSWFENSLDSRLTLRTSYEASDDRGQSLGGANLAVPGLADPNAVVTNQYIGGFTEQVRALGMFANIDLDYKGRYILGGLVRRDAASLFGASQRWQTYGRGSFAWRISEEPWFKVAKISDLKVRASEGTAGNRPQYSAQYETFSIGAGGALAPSFLGNKNLRPEVSREIELGLDLEVMNKYGLTITKAHNVINDQLLPVTPPAVSGFARQWQNAGELTNNTWEVSLNVPVIQKRDLSYSVRFNWDATTSVITRLDMPETFYSAAGAQGAETMFKIKQGEDFGSMWGRRFVDNCSQLPAAFAAKCGPGQEFQKNSNGYVVWVGAGNTLAEGITKNLWYTRLPAAQAPWGGGTTLDNLNWGTVIPWRDSTGAVPLRKLGNALPDFHWSVSQNFAFKKFTVYALLDATVGKSIWNEQRQWSLGDFQVAEADQNGKSVADAKPLGYYFRAVQTGGIGGLYDLLGPNNHTVEDASFVKLRELSLGYRIGKLPTVGGDWTVSLIGRNLKTWTSYTGYDPEVGLGGGDLGSGALNAIDAFTFPNLRQITFSISTSF